MIISLINSLEEISRMVNGPSGSSVGSSREVSVGFSSIVLSVGFITLVV